MKEGLPESLSTLVNELAKLPSIGRRSAVKLAFFLLRSSDTYVYTLADAIRAVHANVQFCELCGHLSDSSICPICSDQERDKSVICVVEDVQDVIAMEKSGSYNGLYHVLGGHLSPLRGITADDINITKLLQRIEHFSNQHNPVSEIIIATNPTADGEATAIYLAQKLSIFPGIQLTRPVLGLSIGSSLELTDEITLRKAFEGRKGI